MKNIEIFNIVTGKLFADLYESFPVPLPINTYSIIDLIVGKDNYDGVWENEPVVTASVKWLADSGYIWVRDPEYQGEEETAVLTPKGLEVLQAMPSSIDSKVSLGDKLIELTTGGLKSGVSQIVKTAISEGVKLAINYS